MLLGAILLTGCQSSNTKEKLAYREEGIAQLDAGDYRGAIGSFEEAIAHSNGFVGDFEIDVLKYRAEAECGAGDYEAAADTYGILCQVDEVRPEYLTRLCALYLLEGQTDKALEGYETVYSLSPDSEDTVMILLSIGDELDEEGRADEALTLYVQALDDGIVSGELYNRMGLIELDAGDYDEALDYFNKGLMTEDEEARPELLYNCCAAYEKKLDFDNALVYLEMYASEFGETDEVAKELAFLRSR